MKKIGLLLTLFAMVLGTNAMAEEPETCPEGQVFNPDLKECVAAPVIAPDAGDDKGTDTMKVDQMDTGE